MNLNLNAAQTTSLCQPFLNYGNVLTVSIPMTPGTVAADSGYIQSLTVPLTNIATADLLVQLNYINSNWITINTYGAQAKPNWAVASEECDFIATFSGNNLTIKVGVFNNTGSPRSIASFTVNVQISQYLSPFQASNAQL